MWILSVGDLFGGRYRIQSELGSGGMSYVFSALDVELSEPVALKVIRPDFVDDVDFVERFKREVRIARQIRHPNIIQVLEFGSAEVKDKKLYYLTMELLEGRDLGAWIRESEEIALSDTLRIGLQVCDALSAAHRFGVVHRDIKPQNIFIEREGRVKLMDFGISRLSTLPSVTTGGQLIGTPKYMAPEQVHRKSEPDHRSDVYALGIVLYELSTRRTPFEGHSTVEIALKQVQQEPPRPSELNSDISEKLERVILRCLEKDPADRYPSAEALREALQAVPSLHDPETLADHVTEVLRMQPTEKTNVTAPTARARDAALPSPEAKIESDTGARHTVRRKAPWYRRKPLALAGAALLAAVAGVVLLRAPEREAPSDPGPDPEAPVVADAGVLEPDVGPENVVGEADEPEPTASPPGADPSPSPDEPEVAAPPPPATSPAPVPAPSEARLLVRSEPAGARVRVDGRDVGRTPWEGDVPPGRRRITLSADGYVTTQDAVDASAGESVTRRFQLAPIVRTATVRFSANPGTDVYVDGEHLGRIPPIVEHELDAGSHLVRYVMLDYAEHEESIRVEARDGQEFSHRFPVPGTVRVNAQPYARVVLDGKDLGFTPVNVEKVAEGEHQLVLEREGFERIEETITVRPFEVNRFQFTMERR